MHIHLPLQELTSSGSFSALDTLKQTRHHFLFFTGPPLPARLLYIQHVILQGPDCVPLKEKRRLTVVLSLSLLTSRKRHRKDVQRPVCWRLQEALAVVVVV